VASVQALSLVARTLSPWCWDPRQRAQLTCGGRRDRQARSAAEAGCGGATLGHWRRCPHRNIALACNHPPALPSIENIHRSLVSGMHLIYITTPRARAAIAVRILDVVLDKPPLRRSQGEPTTSHISRRLSIAITDSSFAPATPGLATCRAHRSSQQATEGGDCEGGVPWGNAVCVRAVVRDAARVNAFIAEWRTLGLTPMEEHPERLFSHRSATSSDAHVPAHDYLSRHRVPLYLTDLLSRFPEPMHAAPLHTLSAYFCAVAAGGASNLSSLHRVRRVVLGFDSLG
jgi:hypothetical protein